MLVAEASSSETNFLLKESATKAFSSDYNNKLDRTANLKNEIEKEEETINSSKPENESQSVIKQQKSIKILKRPTSNRKLIDLANTNQINSTQPIKTFEQREQEYAQARLRILGSAHPVEDHLQQQQQQQQQTQSNGSNSNNIVNIQASQQSLTNNTTNRVEIKNTNVNQIANYNINKINYTLFYLFYINGDDLIQLQAASVLYDTDWRYHTEKHFWLTKLPGVKLKLKTNSFEKGIYIVFDPSSWRKIQLELTIEYNKLAEKPIIPSHLLVNEQHQQDKQTKFCHQFCYSKNPVQQMRLTRLQST